MKIYTKSGDLGETGLFGPDRVSKSSVVVQALGSVDQTNAGIGMILSHISMEPDQIGQSPSLDDLELPAIPSVFDDSFPSQLTALLHFLQSRLFDCGAAIADSRQRPDQYGFASTIGLMESAIDIWQSNLPELKEFLLPGGTGPAACSYWVRAVCRQAERDTVAVLESLKNQNLQNDVENNPLAIRINNAKGSVVLLNRLSDFLFVLGRVFNCRSQIEEPKWKKLGPTGI